MSADNRRSTGQASIREIRVAGEAYDRMSALFASAVKVGTVALSPYVWVVEGEAEPVASTMDVLGLIARPFLEGLSSDSDVEFALVPVTTQDPSGAEASMLLFGGVGSDASELPLITSGRVDLIEHMNKVLGAIPREMPDS